MKIMKRYFTRYQVTSSLMRVLPLALFGLMGIWFVPNAASRYWLLLIILLLVVGAIVAGLLQQPCVGSRGSDDIANPDSDELPSVLGFPDSGISKSRSPNTFGDLYGHRGGNKWWE